MLGVAVVEAPLAVRKLGEVQVAAEIHFEESRSLIYEGDDPCYAADRHDGQEIALDIGAQPRDALVIHKVYQADRGWTLPGHVSTNSQEMLDFAGISLSPWTLPGAELDFTGLPNPAAA